MKMINVQVNNFSVVLVLLSSSMRNKCLSQGHKKSVMGFEPSSAVEFCVLSLNHGTQWLNEPRREKTVLWWFRPGPRQTELYKLRSTEDC